MNLPLLGLEQSQVNGDHAIVWHDNVLFLLDQRILPTDTAFVRCETATEAAQAIRQMVVRGAPAIGITAAYAVVLSAQQHLREHASHWQQQVLRDMERLGASRPTAVNLAWALEKMRHFVQEANGEDALLTLLEQARLIHVSDREGNQRIGELGASLISERTQVITHCNAGALATGGYGTALGVIRSAHARNKIEMVFADETRPWLQGSRLTAWELERDNIPVSLMADGAAAARMQSGGIGWVIVGSDRIAANGDVANKIGTYSLAVAARYHGVKLMVAAPTSTIDLSLATGAEIPIENREASELLSCGDRRVAAEGVDAWNPVFDVTPAELVDAIVTEKGIIHSPNREKLAELMAKKN